MDQLSKEYMDGVTNCYERYVVGHEPMPDNPSTVRSEIYESWKRAKNNGVNPDFITTYKLPDAEFKKVLKENEILFNAATPYIESIYNFVRGTNFLIHLTDKNGCMLKYFADDTQINNLFKNISMLDIGSVRTESLSGTDSAALCLQINKPIQVIGAEHYLRHNHAFFCSSAPIHDTNQGLLGVLTVMGPKELYQEHTLGMVCAAANGIELELQRREFYHRLTVTNSLLDAAIDGLSSAIVILDENHNIEQYNNRFISMFHLPIEDHHGKSFFSILNRDAFPEKIRSLDHAIDDVSFTATTTYNTSSDILVSAKPITVNDGEFTMTLVTFETQKEVHALANKINNLSATFTFDSIIGNSQAITEIKHLGQNAANSTSNVLILGESGTGKELIAQSIHNASDRKNMPFVTINCGSIPKNLIESELFGYESGAFTGANQEGHPGKFELADKGTLFLDEIGDMPLELQASLLRVLQSHEIVRVGGKYPKYVDVRIIAATNIDLIDAVNDKTFRSDLYYRLNVLNILLPPLKDRKDDIPLLVNKFIETYSHALKKGHCTISNDALYLLSQYDWPGNVRELENTIERAINIMEGAQITKEHLPSNVFNASQKQTEQQLHYDIPADFEDVKEYVLSPEVREHDEIIKLLQQERGHVKSVAQRLDVPASTLYRKMKKYGINSKDFKSWQ